MEDQIIYARPRLVIGDLKFTEGPVLDPETGHLIFSDLENNAEYEWHPDGELKVLRQPSGKANGHAFDPQGRLLACEGEARRVSRREPDGTYTTLADSFEGQPLNAPNDIVVSRSGHIYFTDPNYGLKTGEDRQFVYHITPDGQLRKAFEASFNKPNGIGLSPDHQTLYVNVASDHQVIAAPLDASGRPGPYRRIIDGLDRGPDGMTVHPRTGIIFLALFWNNRRKPDEQGINVFTPKGRYHGFIPVPGTTTNCIFDPSGNVLYVTSGGGVYAIDLGFYHGQRVEMEPS